jgi:hypothetical protein
MDLVETITAAVRESRYLVSVHARERLAERGVRLWQVEAGLDVSTIEEIRPDDEPNPSIVVETILPDGTPATVVWSWMAMSGQAKLVTVYFRD